MRPTLSSVAFTVFVLSFHRMILASPYLSRHYVKGFRHVNARHPSFDQRSVSSIGEIGVAVNTTSTSSSSGAVNSSTSYTSLSLNSTISTPTTSSASSTSGSTSNVSLASSTNVTAAIATAPSNSSSTVASTIPTTTTSCTSPSSLAYPTVTAKPLITSPSYLNLTSLIPSILQNAEAISTHSWEIGTMTETLLEVYNPSLTPFDATVLVVDEDNVPWDVLKIAMNVLVGYNWTGAPNTSNSDSELGAYLYTNSTPVPLIPQPLVDGDGALGDPVSLVPATWVLAQYGQSDDVKRKLDTRSAGDYAWAVGNQLQYLLAGTTSSNGTISQRDGYFELWSDMGCMISPSLAYLGLSTSSYALLDQALTQWALESSALLDTTMNIFRHVNDWDARLWATGNGWMLYGFVRNIASIQAAGYIAAFWSQLDQLEETVAKVFTALFNQLDSESLVPNYMLQDNSTLAIGDAAGTALITAAYYRFKVLSPWRVTANTTVLAEKAFDGVVAKIDSDGWLTHVVDPLGTYGWVVYPNDTTLHSPEGQSFVAMMWKARTDAGC